MIRLHYIAAIAAATALAAAPLHAQEDDTPRRQRQSAPLVFSMDELQIHTYKAEHVSSVELYETVDDILGRQLFIQENGGAASPPIHNLRHFADGLVICDTAEYLKRILTVLERLDVQAAESQPSTQLVTKEYTPRFVARDSLLLALESFKRTHNVAKPSGGFDSVRNISFTTARNSIVIRETPETVSEILALLARIDQREPEVLLTCFLVAPGKAGSSVPLPQDLVSDLARLVPAESFTAKGFAMVRTSITPDRQVQIELELENDEGFNLELRPLAYESENGVLTLSACTLEKKTFQETSSGAGVQRNFSGYRQVFSTSATIQRGEYTVIGATGTEPVFVVLRMEPTGA